MRKGALLLRGVRIGTARPTISRSSLALVVMVALVLAVGILTPWPRPALAAVKGADRTDERSAQAAARATGRRVEVAGDRTETATVYANPAGTFTMEQHAQPVRVRRGSGWARVDATLQPAPDGSVMPAASAADLRFSGGGAGPLATLSESGWSASLTWPGALPAPALSGDTAVYANVLPGVDLAVRAAVEGFSEQLVVRSPAAAADPRLAEIRFGLATTGLTFHAVNGGLSGVDGAGAEVVSVPAPAMWDASDRPSIAPVPMSLQAGQLTLRPDLALLTAASTRFPVTIDPSFNANRLNWTVVLDQSPNVSFWNGQNLQSDPHGNGMVGDDPYYLTPARSLFQMNTSAINGTHILSATFQIQEGWSGSCSPRPVELWETGGIGSGTTWYNQPSWNYRAATANVAYGNTTFGCNPNTVEFDATQPVRDASNNRWPNLTLGLRASNEGDTVAWKRFQTNPSLAITYNSIPNTPTGMSVGTSGCVTGANRPFIGTATPQLSATVTDPDNDLLNVTFSWGPVGGSTAGSVTQNSVASGSKAIVTVPSGQFADGGSYFFHVQTTDTIDSSPVSASCEFSVDTTAPSSPPTVTSTDYPNDGNFHGGAGQTGSFTLGANGVSDVAAYQYGWADPPTTQVSAGSLGGAVTITATPSAQGLNTLYVRSVDRAGNLSAITRYTFLAGGPIGPAGQWLADEGSGATLGDASGNGNTATLAGGTSWSSGRPGGGDHTVTFDGSTGYAQTAGPVLHTNQSFSVAAWVRLTTTSTGRWVTAVSQNGTAASSFVLSYNGSNWAFAVHSADSNNPTPYRLAASAQVVAGRWTHLVGVYDAGPHQIQIYVNGVLAGTMANVSPYDSRSTLDIGRARWASNWTDWFPGSVDDVQVWNRVLYPADIQAIANPTTLVGQWGFEEGSGSATADLSGYGHNLTGAGGFKWTSGPTDPGAITLDGSTGAFTAPGPVVLTDQSFTVAAWVRLTDASRFRTAVCQQGSSTCAFFLQYDQTDNRWSFSLTTPDQNNPTSTRALSPSPPQLGTWTFLTGVYDAGAQVIKLYVNGQLVATTSAPPLWNATGVLSVGQARYNGSLTDPWAGDIDNVSVYLGALSDAQVVNLFNS